MWACALTVVVVASFALHLRRAGSPVEFAAPPVPVHEASTHWPREPIRILIDPGHGGRDPGASGPTGLMEKEVVLDVSQRLVRRLRAQGYAVSLTRTGDEAVDLTRRAAMAREFDADLVVSVHINSLPGKARPLVETYYFRPRRRYQRYTTLQWEQKNVTADESAQLAAHVQQAVLAQVRAHNPNVVDNGVRTRGFRVLRGVSVPAVLAELTVLTVPEEESRLRSGSYRDQLAKALAAGVKSYLEARTRQAAQDAGRAMDNQLQADVDADAAATGSTKDLLGSGAIAPAP